nr:NAP1-related protein 2-like isoform X2 [Ipomoea trifida]GME09380.1 NAP1-related protein 2-like isoform X2 [Ipomoea batatas]
MVADRGKKSKVADVAPEEDSRHIDQDLILSIEKLQEVQDELEKVLFSPLYVFPFIFISFRSYDLQFGIICTGEFLSSILPVEFVHVEAIPL